MTRFAVIEPDDCKALLACYLSGQMSEAQAEKHGETNATFRWWLRDRVKMRATSDPKEGR